MIQISLGFSQLYVINLLQVVRPQDRDPRESRQDVQVHARPSLRFRLQDQLRRRKVFRLCSDLRHHGLRQEVRAQVQVGPPGSDREGCENVAETEERKEEQDEEGQGHQEGQGRSCSQEGKLLNLKLYE